MEQFGNHMDPMTLISENSAQLIIKSDVKKSHGLKFQGVPIVLSCPLMFKATQIRVKIKNFAANIFRRASCQDSCMIRMQEPVFHIHCILLQR